jgi:hypothetical protein
MTKAFLEFVPLEKIEASLYGDLIKETDAGNKRRQQQLQISAQQESQRLGMHIKRGMQ